MKLTNYFIKSIIQRIEDDAGYSNDFCHFLQAGVSPQEIGLIENMISVFKTNPFILEKDLINEGLSKKKIEQVLGGVENFKKLVGIESTTFAEWMMFNDYNLPTDVVSVPYHIYLEHYDEINEIYADIALAPRIAVEMRVGEETHLRAIPGVDGNSDEYPIPRNDKEAAEVCSRLIAKDYQSLEYDKVRSTLLLKRLCDKTLVEVEVRCWASELQGHSKKSVCVVNDTQSRTPELWDYVELINKYIPAQQVAGLSYCL
jgi:hypothetical protein